MGFAEIILLKYLFVCSEEPESSVKQSDPAHFLKVSR